MHHAPHLKSGSIGIDDEAGNPRTPFTGAREDDSVAGPVGATDPELRAVEHPLITVAHRLGLNRAGRIAPTARLTQRKESMHFAAQCGVKVLLLLVVSRPIELSQPGATEHAVTGRIQPAAVLGHLRCKQRLGHHIQTRAAELLWNIKPKQTHLLCHTTQPIEVLSREFGGIWVHVGFERDNFFLHESSDVLDQCLLLICGSEVDHDCPFWRPPRRPITSISEGGFQDGMAPFSAR